MIKIRLRDYPLGQRRTLNRDSRLSRSRLRRHGLSKLFFLYSGVTVFSTAIVFVLNGQTWDQADFQKQFLNFALVATMGIAGAACSSLIRIAEAVRSQRSLSQREVSFGVFDLTYGAIVGLAVAVLFYGGVFNLSAQAVRWQGVLIAFVGGYTSRQLVRNTIEILGLLVKPSDKRHRS